MKQIFIKSKDVLATLSQLADERGLLFLGVSSLDVKQDFKWFQDWLSEGRQAGMTYLERHPRLREHPESILEGKPANSAFCFAMPYQQGDRWRRGEGHVVPKIAMYARLKDYHRTLKHDLSRIAESLKESLGDDFSYRVTVDSAPLLERALAANTTSGFIGKNTC